MQSPYISNTDDDRKKMLDSIGVKSFEQLLEGIPAPLRLNRPLDIPKLSEVELLKEIQEMSSRSREGLLCFAGGGVYDHFIPAAVATIITRPEFMTAYTPYQPEVAQGTLQVIYEFQTHICRLTGMDVANASMYDGASAAAEAVIISTGVTKRNKIVISEAVNPLYRQVIMTYLQGRELEVVTVPLKDGVTDLARLEDLVDEKTACVLVGQPNFFGLLEEVEAIEKVIHKVGGKLIMAVDLVAQAILKTPGESHAGSYRRTNQRSRRQDRLRADPADQRTAYSSRKSDLEYLYQPGALCRGRIGVPQPDGQDRTQESRPPVG
jgi:glycine dehydrogenase subunit 1